MKIIVGIRYRVCEGSGLDSGRVGVALCPRGYSQNFFREIEPGRYKDFDPSREAFLMDDKGNFFTMFKDRLEIA